MSDLVGNPEDRFSQNEAHIKVLNLGTPQINALSNLKLKEIVLCFQKIEMKLGVGEGERGMQSLILILILKILVEAV